MNPGRCAWCRASLAGKRPHARTCSQRCRQAHARFAGPCEPRPRATDPIRLAYADPPYPGLAHYYEGHRDYAGEVDHGRLLSRLQHFDGWALSTSADALPELLAICVRRRLPVHVASWIRGHRPGPSRRPKSAWEPVIYCGGRRIVSSTPPLDALVYAAHPRFTEPERVIGMKPARFAFWIFDLLGARPGDAFADLFPGSGGITRAWSIFNRNASHVDEPEPSHLEVAELSSDPDAPDASPSADHDTSGDVVGDRSGEVLHDGSARARHDGSRAARRDASPPAPRDASTVH